MIKVIIDFGDTKLRSIKVDNTPMEKIDYLKGLPIPSWFKAMNDRRSWDGLISEIYKLLSDEKAELSFEFIGIEDQKVLFVDCLRKAGLEMNNQPMSKNDLIKRAKEAATQFDENEDFISAREQYELAANLGDTEAQYMLSQYFEKGCGGNISKDRAFDYCFRAANKGYVKAYEKLGDYYKDGCGTDASNEHAIKWYQKAVDNGETDAQKKLEDCQAETTTEISSANETNAIEDADIQTNDSDVINEKPCKPPVKPNPAKFKSFSEYHAASNQYRQEMDAYRQYMNACTKKPRLKDYKTKLEWLNAMLEWEINQKQKSN